MCWEELARHEASGQDHLDGISATSSPRGTPADFAKGSTFSVDSNSHQSGGIDGTT